MHVVVIGAGVIGVTSAWYLAQAGHRVTVLERQRLATVEPGMDLASGAYAGVLPPICPAKGCSLAITADSDAARARSTIAKETCKAGISNLGDRIRIGGRTELKGFDLSRPGHRFRRCSRCWATSSPGCRRKRSPVRGAGRACGR